MVGVLKKKQILNFRDAWCLFKEEDKVFKREELRGNDLSIGSPTVFLGAEGPCVFFPQFLWALPLLWQGP